MFNFKYGIISDLQKGKAKVFFDDDNIVSAWLPVVVRKSKSDKESWQLEINEHVVCLMDEDCTEGVILGAIVNDQDVPDAGEGPGKFRKLFSDGTLIEYDKTAAKLTVDVKGQISAKATGKVVIDAGGDLEAKSAGKATVQGNTIECTATGSAKVKGSSISLEGNVSVTGNLAITGTVAAGGPLTAASIAAGGASMAGGNLSLPGNLTVAGKGFLTHTHTAPPGGGTTSAPL